MGIESNFDMGAINSYLNNRLRTLEELVVRNLNYLGMQCVTIAKNLDTYKDRSGNLRNSIGYIVVAKGVVVNSLFEGSTAGNGKSTSDEKGDKVGAAFARGLAEKYSEGYVLIVVAGMKYASYVEDVHHLAVLEPAENYAKSNMLSVANRIVNSMK
ncbi:hypothetical protein CMU19_04515 [Elizabethkingia anophelis]|nr:hypothetical protein [Elizabethkingia anophelis]